MRLSRGGRRAAGGRAGYTLVELLVAVGLAAGVVMAFGGLAWQAVRAGEARSALARGPHAAERALFGMMHELACAWAPPGLKEDEKAFELTRGDGVKEALAGVKFYGARAGGDGEVWVERVGYEMWPAAEGKGRELRRLAAACSGVGAGEWVTNVVFRGEFGMDVAVRAVPEAAGGVWGEWVEEWPPMEEVRARRAGEEEEKETKEAPGVPGAVRLEMALGSGERWVLDALVQSALPVARLRAREGE